MKVYVHDMGDTVLCDSCNADYTNSDEQGGILFGSHAFCPKCATSMESLAKKYNETGFIRDRAKPGETFKAFCLRLRGGDNTVTITTFKI